MKTIIISTAFALLAAIAQASPAPAQAVKAREFDVIITFIGVGPTDTFTQAFPSGGERTFVENSESFSKISSEGGASCTFFGVDGSTTTVVGDETVDVGPPQEQIYGVCDAL